MQIKRKLLVPNCPPPNKDCSHTDRYGQNLSQSKHEKHEKEIPYSFHRWQVLSLPEIAVIVEIAQIKVLKPSGFYDSVHKQGKPL